MCLTFCCRTIIKMKTALLCLSIIVMNSCVDGKWRPEYRDKSREVRQNGVSNDRQTYSDPPDHNKLIPMARYVLHNTGKFLLIHIYILLIIRNNIKIYVLTYWVQTRPLIFYRLNYVFVEFTIILFIV